jgi:hypothetical protein
LFDDEEDGVVVVVLPVVDVEEEEEAELDSAPEVEPSSEEFFSSFLLGNIRS